MSYKNSRKKKQYVKYEAHCPAAPLFAYDEKLIDIFLELILLALFSNTTNKHILLQNKVHLISFSRQFSIKVLKLLEKLKNIYPDSNISEPRSREWLTYDVNELSIGHKKIYFIGSGHYYNLGFALSLFKNHTFLFLIDLLIISRNDYDPKIHGLVNSELFDKYKEDILTKICIEHQKYIYGDSDSNNMNVFTNDEISLYEKMRYYVEKLLKGCKYSFKVKTVELKNYKINKNNETNQYEYVNKFNINSMKDTNNNSNKSRSKKKKSVADLNQKDDIPNIINVLSTIYNINSIDDYYNETMNDIELKDKIIKTLEISEKYNNLDISINTLDKFIKQCHMEGADKIVFTGSVVGTNIFQSSTSTKSAHDFQTPFQPVVTLDIALKEGNAPKRFTADENDCLNELIKNFKDTGNTMHWNVSKFGNASFPHKYHQHAQRKFNANESLLLYERDAKSLQQRVKDLKKNDLK